MRFLVGCCRNRGGVNTVMRTKADIAANTGNQELSSRGFTKLDSGIVFSSVWRPEHDIVRVWIALLALCDARGVVRSSVPALAHLCFIEVERLAKILKIFRTPDPYSRIRDHQGRKIKDIEGGWLVLNYPRYRNTLMQRKPFSHAERQSRYRERQRTKGSNGK
jgi:hypothetical protein